MSYQIGTFMRYTTEEHRDLLEAFPKLEPILFRPTFVEAEEAAMLAVMRSLKGLQISRPVRFYHKPHRDPSEDPLDYVGSWGWKTE